MPVLQLNDQHFPLNAGTTRIGAGGDADVPLPSHAAAEEGILALIDRAGSDRLTIRRASPDAKVRVNGVLLGAEPTPLMHGDRLEIAGVELRFAEDTQGGATQFVSASKIAEMPGAKRAGAAKPTAASGGRLVSLVDGKEYTVPASGLVIGRDAACDVVVAQNEVSRRHAEIAPGEQGYLVRDTSANGVFVNGDRVQGSHRLARADVLRVGSEEFRFYADVLAAAPAPEASAPSRAPAAPAVEPAHAAMMSAPTPLASPKMTDPRPVLATLEILNEGPSKGVTFTLRTPLAHVGRGAHNDVRLADESVSETHAKLQRREDGWYVVDMNSTNGTYVGGSRIIGERRLEGTPDVRFGGMKLRFTSTASEASAPEVKGTRAIASVERLRRAVPAPGPAVPPTAVATGGRRRWVWILVALLITAVLLVLTRRA